MPELTEDNVKVIMRNREKVTKLLDEITLQYGGTDWTLIMFHKDRPHYMALSNLTSEASLERFKIVIDEMLVGLLCEEAHPAWRGEA